MLLENTTIGRKELNIRTKRGVISVAFESSEVKEVPDHIVDLLKGNPANMMYFNNNIIRKAKVTSKKIVKADVKEKREVIDNPKLDKKGKGKKGKPKADDDLDL